MYFISDTLTGFKNVMPRSFSLYTTERGKYLLRIKSDNIKMDHR